MTIPIKQIFLLLVIITLLSCDLFVIPDKDENLTLNMNVEDAISSSKIIQLTKQERSFLDKLGILQVLVDDDFAPISFYNTESNEFTGIAVEVLQILSRTLQFEYEIIRNPELSWSDRLDEIKNKKIHILGGASKNIQRQQYGYFTESEYFRMSYALIGSINNHIYLTDISQIKNFRIGLLDGVTINNYILENLDDTSNITYFETKEDLFTALNHNEIDIVTKNEATFNDEFFKGKLFDFEIVFSIHEVQKNYAFFCPKTDEGKFLTEILNKGMKEININKLISKLYNYKSIYSYYKEYTEKLQQNIYKRNILIIIIMSFFAAALTIVVLIRKQAKQKERLINKLEKALCEVKTLSGLLPICSHCKKIRDEKGYWKQIESYIETNTDAQFSHSLCEKCLEELYGDEEWFKKRKNTPDKP